MLRDCKGKMKGYRLKPKHVHVSRNRYKTEVNLYENLYT